MNIIHVNIARIAEHKWDTMLSKFLAPWCDTLALSDVMKEDLVDINFA